MVGVLGAIFQLAGMGTHTQNLRASHFIVRLALESKTKHPSNQ
jgi:hypothetical protein